MEIAMHCKEMTSQLQIQHEESRAHQQMMNVMMMAMMQNIAGTNQQQRSNIVGTNQHHRTDGNNQQAPFDIVNGTNQQLRTDISRTNQQNGENNK